MKRVVIAATLLAPAVAHTDPCSDKYPGGVPPPTAIEKLRLDAALAGRSGTPLGGGVSGAIEAIVHPQLDLGLEGTYVAHDHALDRFEVVFDARVFVPFFTSGGIASHDVCGWEPRNWLGRGAPYLDLGIGGDWTARHANDGHFVFRPALGWEYGLGRAFAVFADAGRVIETAVPDHWNVRLGVRF